MYTVCTICSALVIRLEHGQIFAIVMVCSSLRCYLCHRYAQYTPYSTHKLDCFKVTMRSKVMSQQGREVDEVKKLEEGSHTYTILSSLIIKASCLPKNTPMGQTGAFLTH